MTDYCTLTQVKAYINTVESGDDTKLSQYITQASRRIDIYCGRTFTANTATRLYDAIADVDGRTLYLDDDLLSVTSLYNGDGTVITSGQYVLEPANQTQKYAIKLRSSASISWTYTTDPEQSIAVYGAWGFYNGTVAPEDIQHAAIRLTAWYYAQQTAPFDQAGLLETGVITVPSAVPPDVRALLDQYQRVDVGAV